MNEYILNLIKHYGVGIVWILAVLIFSKLILRFIVHRLIKIIANEKHFKEKEIETRTKTIWNLLSDIGNALIYIIVLLMTLNLFGVNISALLGGLGILGVAFGFGAQSLVKDFISGILMLMENQYNVGDKVQIGDSKGIVEKITVRSIVIKDENDALHYIANGSINKVINFSKKK